MAKTNPLLQLGNVPVSTVTIETCFSGLSSPQKKIQALKKTGDLIRLKRDLYVVDSKLSGKPISIPLCANHLYGPSYVSSRWALQWYGLIPEQVFRVVSMTTKHARCFETPLGIFDYHKTTPNYHSIGIRIEQEGDVSFLMASPEKALCDMILLDKFVPDQSVKRLVRYLEEDIRFDMDELAKFNVSILESCAKKGGKKLVFNNLIKIVKQ